MAHTRCHSHAAAINTGQVQHVLLSLLEGLSGWRSWGAGLAQARVRLQVAGRGTGGCREPWRSHLVQGSPGTRVLDHVRDGNAAGSSGRGWSLGGGVGCWGVAQWVRLAGGQWCCSPSALLACHPGISDPLKCVPWGSFRAGRALWGLPGKHNRSDNACSAHSPVAARGFSWGPGPRIRPDRGTAAQLILCFSPAGS